MSYSKNKTMAFPTTICSPYKKNYIKANRKVTKNLYKRTKLNSFSLLRLFTTVSNSLRLTLSTFKLNIP